MKRGDRVFVGGNVGKYGKLIDAVRTLGTPYYFVLLDGSYNTTGPYSEVWPAMLSPDPRERV